MANQDLNPNDYREPVGLSGLIDVQQLAQILQVPRSWVYQRTRLGPGAIPHVKLGKYVRFNAQEVIAFFRAKGNDGNNGTNHVS